ELFLHAVEEGNEVVQSRIRTATSGRIECRADDLHAARERWLRNQLVHLYENRSAGSLDRLYAEATELRGFDRARFETVVGRLFKEYALSFSEFPTGLKDVKNLFGAYLPKAIDVAAIEAQTVRRAE